MCGIAGVAGRTPEALRPLRAMTSALRHRGPDDEGYLLVDSGSARATAYGGADTVAAAGLPHLPETLPPGCDLGPGNRRLSIIDPSPAGPQPMASPDGPLWVTYN